MCADNISTPLCSLVFQNAHYARCINTCAAAASNRDRCVVSAFRKQHSRNLPPGSYEMVDDETGEKVIVFGVEGADGPPPSDEELRWKPAKHVKQGEISDQAWYRILKSSQPTSEPDYYPKQGRAADFSDDDIDSFSNSKSSELLPKKKYTDTSTVTSKGLFSRLKVQTSRSRKKSGSDDESGRDEKDRRLSRQEDLEASNSLWGDEDERNKRVSKSEKNQGFDSIEDDDIVPRLEDLEAPSSWLKSDKEIKRRVQVNQGRQSSKDSAVSSSKSYGASHSVQNLEGKRTRATKAQRSFKEVVAEDFFSIRSFKDVGANDEIIQSLHFMEVRRPSQIQAMAYQHILEGRSCILADQTGSGKTLAYLVPLFQRFLVEEEEGSSKSLPKRPRGLIMVPTSELAAQVLSVCRLFSKGGAPLKSMVATGGFRLKTQVEALEDSPDIVIATPGRFLQLSTLGSLALENIKSVVLDEVDVLFDDPEFSDTLERIESSAPFKTQYIHVTATLPVDVCDAILEKHPTSVPLMGPGLHCTATGLQEVLVDCSGQGEKTPESAYENKKNALLQLVEQQPVSKTIIFCNKIETCRKVENVLKRSDRKGSRLSVLPYHAALSLEVRHESMQQFMKVDSEKSMYLVCTDRASRGLDLVDVEHVVLFDFPRDPSEYVRRVGRTARAGGVGKAFVFVVGKQVSLARKIMVRNEKGHPIHTVPSHSY